ncbi:MAG: hypothetical protein JNG89_16655 [Planctomycetaceae bacterium]|nr:hypothetical protein [Planctomycetaceae bacterium]
MSVRTHILSMNLLLALICQSLVPCCFLSQCVLASAMPVGGAPAECPCCASSCRHTHQVAEQAERHSERRRQSDAPVCPCCRGAAKLDALTTQPVRLLQDSGAMLPGDTFTTVIAGGERNPSDSLAMVPPLLGTCATLSRLMV